MIDLPKAATVTRQLPALARVPVGHIGSSMV